MSGEGVLVPISIFLGGFAMVFGIVYLRTRENLAMLEKGLNPKENLNRPAPYKNLKWGLLLMGAGIGLLLAYILDQKVFMTSDNEAIYFALIAIGGGAGLIGSYRIEKKEFWDKSAV
jgi:hypothetical protein